MGLRRWLAVLALPSLACSLSGESPPAAAPVASATIAATVASTATAPPPTPVPFTPTPLPPVIGAGNVAGLKAVLSFGGGAIRSLAIAPDGSVVAVTEGNPEASLGTIRLYDAATGSPVRTLDDHTSGVWDLAFSPDGRFLASASRDRTARVWDWMNGTTVATLQFPNEAAAVGWSPDSQQLAVGGVDEAPGQPLNDASIWTYAVDTWQPMNRMAEYWNIADIVYTPDGSRLAGGGTSRNVRVWTAADGAEVFILYHSGQVGDLAVSPDGSTLASALCEASGAFAQCTRGAVWLWSLSTGRQLRSLADFASHVDSVAYSPDGSLLVAAAGDGMLRVYSTVDYRILFEAQSPAGEAAGFSDMAISADGRFLATCGADRVYIWRVVD